MMIDAAGTHVIYEVKHLEKSFGKVEVLKDINIQIGNGEVLTIIGPSGSGKSTFLRCLNLLEKPTGGELWFDGRLIDGKTDVKMLRRDVGMVFQSFNLFPMFSAVENVMYAPVHINKLDKKQAKEEAMELLSRVGISSPTPPRCSSNHASQNSSPSRRDTFSGRLSKKMSRIVMVVISAICFFSIRSSPNSTGCGLMLCLAKLTGIIG